MPPDVLLTDVVLPGRSGRELAEEAKKLYPQLKVLFATGYTDDPVLLERLRVHDVDLLRKPFTAEQLAARLRDTLDRES